MRFSRHAVAMLACGIAALAIAPSAFADGVPFSRGEVLADVGNGQIRHFSNTGTLLDTLNTNSGTNEGDGMCFDGRGNLYATQGFSANTVSEFNNQGNLVTTNFGSGYDGHPESCVVDQAGDVYVGQPDGSTHVLKFDSSGNLLATYAPATQGRGTDWIDLAGDQCTLHYTSEGNSIKQFNVCTNTQLPDFATGLAGGTCYGHRILADGGELVACSSQIDRVNASGVLTQTYSLPNTSLLFAINLDPDGTSFWTADYYTGQIFRVDIATGAVLTTFTSTPSTVMGGLTIVGEITAASDPKITAVAPTSLSATEGKAFSGPVATFTDPDTSATASEYSATITWGDGSTSTGTITGSGGSFSVTGGHTYAEEGSHAVSVTITDTDNTANTATASTSAQVADAALHGASGSPTKTNNGTVTGTVATFTDDDPGGTVADYTASINWGDGTTTTGTVTASTGKFNVAGSHTYKKNGTFVVTVTIKDAGGSTTTASESVTITNVAAKRGKPKVVHGTASLSGLPLVCVSRAFTVRILGKQISSVTWLVDGKRIAGRTVHRGTKYSARISVVPGIGHLTVKVKFVRLSQPKARTIHALVSGCRVVVPKFTG